jgi:hypothetical protein
MPDDVWPISIDNPSPESLYSVNGFGFGFKGFTRTDATGFCFATRWVMFAGLAVLPLDRYYLRDVGYEADASGDTTTRYDIAGSAGLRPGEILRTYAFSWLTPVAAIWPLIAVLQRADDLPFWVSLGAVLLWPITVIALAVAGLAFYRNRLAPIRDVRWRTRTDPE